MDKQFLDCLLVNGQAFVGGLVGGIGVGYVSSRNDKFDAIVGLPNVVQLGYSTLFSAGILTSVGVIARAENNINFDAVIPTITQATPGTIAGFYTGLKLGKAMEQALDKLYMKRDMHKATNQELKDRYSQDDRM